MPKARKRKQPLQALARPHSSSSKPEASRKVIRRYHVLLKSQAQLEHEQSPQSIEGRARIQQELDEMGGLEAYQKMSSIGQSSDRGGDTGKVLISWLHSHRLARAGDQRLKLLEVGALEPDNYRTCESWLEVTSIDLRSRHPKIKEQDFLLLDLKENHEVWDVISLSLVINFVAEPKSRGRMLQMAHSMLRPDGLLFVVLPQPCVSNSRYLTEAHFSALVACAGFDEVEKKSRRGGKLTYSLLRKSSRRVEGQKIDEKFTKKSVLLTGNRNNFCILLS